MTHKQRYKKLLRLCDRWTRCEVMARLGPTGGGVDYYNKMIKNEDRIRKLLYGTSDLAALAKKWGMFKKRG